LGFRRGPEFCASPEGRQVWRLDLDPKTDQRNHKLTIAYGYLVNSRRDPAERPHLVTTGHILTNRQSQRGDDKLFAFKSERSLDVPKPRDGG
jgi:hypothetical protein